MFHPKLGFAEARHGTTAPTGNVSHRPDWFSCPIPRKPKSLLPAGKGGDLITHFFNGEETKGRAFSV
jgi:hypothetical protein